MTLLYEGSEWTADLIDKTYEAIEEIALNELNLNIYPNRIDIVSSDQMLDAYSSIGMPIFYKHWSFGKSFSKNELQYRKGFMGLAYEMVINSSPCISYCMEENSMTMQTLVMAHAACISGDTEYLSENGWRRIDQYDGGKVGQYSYDFDNHRHIVFVNPTNYITRPQRDFVHIVSDRVNQAITDDHTVVLVNDDGELFKTLGEHVQNQKGSFIVAMQNNFGEFELSNLEECKFSRIPSEDGMAYCFTVPSGMFVIRRDNKISVTGNCGHNHFFKNNYLFKEWTDATTILDYLAFAKKYISDCEEKYGQEVEQLLDSCHALMNYGVDLSKRPKKLSIKKEEARQEERQAYLATQVNELWTKTLPKKETDPTKEKPFPIEPEENILWFCEKFAPELPSWKREIIRIIRKISQYFAPQSQTKTENEGFATYTHYKIMNRLLDKGQISHGSYLEFIHSHTSVVFQPEFDDRRYSGINPYALGFAMFMDIERVCNNPTDEDREWVPGLIGMNANEAILDVVANYRDESFIRQFLTPTVARQFRLFHLNDQSDEFEYEVKNIHNERGFKALRKALADQYEPNAMKPNIMVRNVNKKTREMTLLYKPFRRRKLKDKDMSKMMAHIRNLWGYNVVLYDDKGNELGADRR